VAKCTERALKDACWLANQGVLKNWSFGLRVERHGNGFMLYKLFRNAGDGMCPLFVDQMSAKETYRYIQWFIAAVVLANGGDGMVSDGKS